MTWNGVKKGSVLLLILSFNLLCSCESNETIITADIAVRTAKEIQIIPQPNSLSVDSGYFQIDEGTAILNFLDDNAEAKYLQELIETASTFKPVIFNETKVDWDTVKNVIVFDHLVKPSSPEAYKLNITSEMIRIDGKSGKGVMHGIQTLRQLMVDEFHSGEKRENWYLPQVKITDSPKFKHRGLLLDCARHFYSKTVVKKYIDLLALYKMNVLHWHLTEDQGWRIEIDAYPKLTEVGAWRTELDGSRYGGFYSKADIKEIVAYANERQVTIIPEIELPGHSQAAIAAYSSLSCEGVQVPVINDWGVFKEIYCAGNDSVFTFLETVLTEVMDLFPAQYIHIGGDEAPKFRWEHCDKCQARMKAHDLKDEHELQSYFISRVETFLNENGRQLIGWDEILEGGLSANATVQSWRGMEGGITAANSGHEAIMSPTSHAYFDYDLKAIDLEKVYQFDPIPKELPEDKTQFIIGGECNIWTEHVPDEATLDAKVFPRLLGMSEVLWHYPESRDYLAFYNRVQFHYPMLEYLAVKYGLETLPIGLEVEVAAEGIGIVLKPGHPSLNLKYAWSTAENPVQQFQNYDSIIGLKGTSGELNVLAFKGDELYGDTLTQCFESHLGLCKLVKNKYEYSEWYTAGGNTGLVDGKVGTLDFRDGNWQGYWGYDAELILDLGKVENVSMVCANFYQYINAWIFSPDQMTVLVSEDGENYTKIETIKGRADQKDRTKQIESFVTNFEMQSARYIKVIAKNIGDVPDWHEAAGAKSWVFIDEIIVK